MPQPSLRFTFLPRGGPFLGFFKVLHEPPLTRVDELFHLRGAVVLRVRHEAVFQPEVPVDDYRRQV